MKLLAAALFVSALAVPSSALAQKKIPKAQGHNQCPLGYVNTLGTTCVSPIFYKMKPTNGEACPPAGWVLALAIAVKSDQFSGSGLRPLQRSRVLID